MRNLDADQVLGNVPVQFTVRDADQIRLVERADQLLIRLESQRAKEDGPQELALSVDTHIQEILLVVLKLYPGAPVGNDLSEKVGFGISGFEEDSGGAV